jgi:predicted DNA-binding antitoxin AbrB/MazE fold protein
MKHRIQAIYEHGVFRPLTPPPLVEKERVDLVVERNPEGWLDLDAHSLAEREPEPDLSLEDIRAELGMIPGCWADDIIEERGEY